MTPIPATGVRTAQVVIEQRQATMSGFPVETWVTLLTVHMEKVDRPGAEAFRANQTSAWADVLFIGPYRQVLDPEIVDVPATQRLQYRGRTYNITSARRIGPHRESIEYVAMTSTQIEGVA